MRLIVRSLAAAALVAGALSCANDGPTANYAQDPARLNGTWQWANYPGGEFSGHATTLVLHVQVQGTGGTTGAVTGVCVESSPAYSGDDTLTAEGFIEGDQFYVNCSGSLPTVEEAFVHIDGYVKIERVLTTYTTLNSQAPPWPRLFWKVD